MCLCVSIKWFILTVVNNVLEMSLWEISSFCQKSFKICLANTTKYTFHYTADLLSHACRHTLEHKCKNVGEKNLKMFKK